ncbi:hypothetical protein ACOMHN_051146 [Nucella lapillus]
MTSSETSRHMQDVKDMSEMSEDFHNQSTHSIAAHCRIIDNNTRIPWNHPGNVVSWQTEELFYKVCSGLLIPLFFIFGTPANVLNMVVFYKQGLKERINFCLFFLALVDILHLTPLFIFQVEHINSWFTGELRNGEIYRFMRNNNLLGFYGFGYGSMLLAAVISTERCVCVLFPLTVQRCIPTKAFAFVVVFAVLTVSMLFFISSAQYRSGCYYEVRTQRISWQYEINHDYFSKHEAMLRVLDGAFYGVLICIGCPALVLITTIITAIKLRQIVRWRSHSSSVMSSPKEMGLTRMLMCLSAEFIVLSSPLMIGRVTRLFPSVVGLVTYRWNVFRILGNCYEISFYISSSVNFVVYYVAGSKYRDTLRAVLGVRGGGHRTGDSRAVSASAAMGVSGGGHRTGDSRAVSASAAMGVRGGGHRTGDSRAVSASAAMGVSGGGHRTGDSRAVSASAAMGVSGGGHRTGDSRAVSASAAMGVSGGGHRTGDSRAVSASAAMGVSGGGHRTGDSRAVSASAAMGVRGWGHRTGDSRAVSASAAMGVSGGGHRTGDSRAVSASAAMGVRGGAHRTGDSKAASASASV